MNKIQIFYNVVFYASYHSIYRMKTFRVKVKYKFCHLKSWMVQFFHNFICYTIDLTCRYTLCLTMHLDKNWIINKSQDGKMYIALLPWGLMCRCSMKREEPDTFNSNRKFVLFGKFIYHFVYLMVISIERNFDLYNIIE